jgi:hypothetical protein
MSTTAPLAEPPPRLTAAEHDAFPQGLWASIPVPISDRTLIVLPAGEAMELQFCEQRIEHGLETFLEVGQALQLIRDKRLYRVSHGTFEEYCQARWDIKGSRARQLCAAAQIVQGLKATAETILPTSESQVRPLMSLPAEQQQTVWREAVATGAGVLLRVATARHD